MDLASTVQAAAVAGIGLLYQGSSHRLMTEFLLNEIGRQPMKDQNANDREGFALVSLFLESIYESKMSFVFDLFTISSRVYRCVVLHLALSI